MSGGGLISDSGGLGGMLGGLSGGLGINLSGIPFVGGMFGSPEEAAMRQSMANAVQSYQNMREPQAQGYQSAMARFGQGMQPVQSALNWMYGGPEAGQGGQAPPQQSPGPAPSVPPSGGGGTSLFPSGGGGGGGGGLLGGIGGIGGMLGLGQNAPLGLPGPGLGGALSGNPTGNLPGLGWKGPSGMPGGGMLSGLPGMGGGGIPGLGSLGGLFR